MKPGWAPPVAIAMLLGSAGLGAVLARPMREPLPPAIVGLDHIPVAVGDLERASERYRALGFALKPGTPHENGIRNQHVKFTDGTEIELITAPTARDALTTTYRRHLDAGDGPAFLAFYAPSIDLVAERLDATRRSYRRDRGFLDLPDTDALRYIFFGPRNRSPTDRPEHFRHPNSAESLIAVWLADDNLSEERAMIEALGGTVGREEVHVPEATSAVVAHLQEGDVVLLSGSHQLVPGRRIVGATVRVASLAAARRLLERGPWPAPRTQSAGRHSSVFLPPSITYGIWLELRE